MTNRGIANAFNQLASIMELHGENKFKIRSYQNAYRTLRSFEKPLAELSDAEIGEIKGVGKAIAGKIRELVDGGTMATLERYKSQTPEGLVALLGIKGLGVKKIQTVWKDLGIESPGELYYACMENRLVSLKGFGEKTQKDIEEKLAYHLQSRDKFHFASLDKAYKQITTALKNKLSEGEKIEPTGAFRRKNNVLQTIELLSDTADLSIFHDLPFVSEAKQEENKLHFKTPEGFPVIIHQVEKTIFDYQQMQLTGGEFLEAKLSDLSSSDANEAVLFEQINLPFIQPELRDNEAAENLAKHSLISPADVLGVTHAHSTYSDGAHSLLEMAEACQQLGYQYLVITDHSQSAFYAGGLKPEEVFAQHEEIDRLNAEFNNFKIFKGIESDILNDGNLDYEEDILKSFEVIIASVHSNLKMDEEKATSRILKAIENPYTTILGHPTSRLLLSRKGYDLDHKKIIDACAANQVAIEMNANPYRLDLDWRWIPYCMEKGVKIAINPDAHSTVGIQDIVYGVYAARKGGLRKEFLWDVNGDLS